MKEMNEKYINDKMIYLAQDIDTYDIGDNVLDRDGKICIITDKTSNSIEIFIDKKTEKGINVKQWFTMNDFNKRFKRY